MLTTSMWLQMQLQLGPKQVFTKCVIWLHLAFLGCCCWASSLILEALWPNAGRNATLEKSSAQMQSKECRAVHKHIFDFMRRCPCEKLSVLKWSDRQSAGTHEEWHPHLAVSVRSSDLLSWWIELVRRRRMPVWETKLPYHDIKPGIVRLSVLEQVDRQRFKGHHQRKEQLSIGICSCI